MSYYKLIEKTRDSNNYFSYALLKDNEVQFQAVLYSQGMNFVYENINNGDYFQEIYLDGSSSGLLSYNEMLNSFGMKSFLNKKAIK